MGTKLYWAKEMIPGGHSATAKLLESCPTL